MEPDGTLRTRTQASHVRALADAGQVDAAYTLLGQDTEPSWLTMIDRDATTVWERWNGVDADGVAHESLNLTARARWRPSCTTTTVGPGTHAWPARGAA